MGNNNNSIEYINYIANLISSLDWASFIWGVRSIMMFLGIILIPFFLFLLLKSWSQRPNFSNPSKVIKQGVQTSIKGMQEIKDRWVKILEKAYSAPPHSLNLAIIEADKLADDAIKKMGIQGEHMADRLEKLSSSDFGNIEKLWRAHRIRNELVHEPDFEISKTDAKEVLKIYDDFFKEVEKL